MTHGDLRVVSRGSSGTSPAGSSTPGGARLRLIESLEARFNHPLTTVVAGAGFGKTTVLAQALRANLAATRGIDGWVSCEASDGDDRRLAAPRECSSTGHASRIGSKASWGDARARPGRRVRRARRPPRGPRRLRGAALGRRAVELLAPHGHLVLASRVPVPFALARRRAAGQVVDLGTDDLTFRPGISPRSCASTAASGRSCPTSVAALPRRVDAVGSAGRGQRLPVGRDHRFALRDDRRALLAMITLGWGSARTSRWSRERRTAPHSSPGSCGRCHSSRAATSRASACTNCGRSDDPHLRRRRSRDSSSEDIGAVGRARRGVAARVGGDPMGRHRRPPRCHPDPRPRQPRRPADRYRQAVARRRARRGRDRPELRLLSLALRQAEQVWSADIDAEVDDVIETFERHPDGVARRGDRPRRGRRPRKGRPRPPADPRRARPLAPRSGDLPLLRFLPGRSTRRSPRSTVMRKRRSASSTRCRSARAGGRDRAGDTASGDDADADGSCRRSGGAAACLAESADPHVRDIPAHVRWQAGDPWEFAARPPNVDDSVSINDRDQFMSAAEAAAVASSLGDETAAAQPGSGSRATTDGTATHATRRSQPGRWRAPACSSTTKRPPACLRRPPRCASDR